MSGLFFPLPVIYQGHISAAPFLWTAEPNAAVCHRFSPPPSCRAPRRADKEKFDFHLVACILNNKIPPVTGTLEQHFG